MSVSAGVGIWSHFLNYHGSVGYVGIQGTAAPLLNALPKKRNLLTPRNLLSEYTICRILLLCRPVGTYWTASAWVWYYGWINTITLARVYGKCWFSTKNGRRTGLTNGCSLPRVSFEKIYFRIYFIFLLQWDVWVTGYICARGGLWWLGRVQYQGWCWRRLYCCWCW